MKVPAEKLRWAVGSIVAEGDDKPDDEIVKLFEQSGFKLFNLPAVSKAVITTFPHNTFLSIYLYVYRVYSAVDKYLEVSVMSHFVVLNLDTVNVFYLKQDAVTTEQVDKMCCLLFWPTSSIM